MSDGVWLVVWSAVLAAGVGGCVILHRRGVASTHVRDLLHVGTGIWVLGWPAWHGPAAPIALTAVVAAATAAVPWLGRRSDRVQRLASVFARGDERFAGLVLYAMSYAALTAIGFTVGWFPAAAALLALSLGDGLGGAVGLWAGRHRYRPPFGKDKSVEGSAVVALASSAGVAVAGWRFGAELGLASIVGLGAAASLAEALAPRGSDNLIVPAVVWGLAQGVAT